MARRKIIITVAVTGGLHGKSANPNLPEQPEEIAEVAYQCCNEGAAIVHIHARDPQGKPTGDRAVYSRINELVRSKCNIIINNTTGGGPNLSTLEQRIQCIYAEPRPEMASLNMGTMMRTLHPFEGIPFLAPRSEIEEAARQMLERNVKPEMEVYNPAMFREVRNLIEKDLVRPPYFINLVLGMPHQNAVDGTPEHFWFERQLLIPGSIYNVTAIGPAQLPLTTIAMALDGHVRVGLEDNIYYVKGVLASNPQLVARAVRIARELDLEVASPDDAREMLGIRH